jgi:hypothetical protein
MESDARPKQQQQQQQHEGEGEGEDMMAPVHAVLAKAVAKEDRLRAARTAAWASGAMLGREVRKGLGMSDALAYGDADEDVAMGGRWDSDSDDGGGGGDGYGDGNGHGGKGKGRRWGEGKRRNKSDGDGGGGGGDLSSTTKKREKMVF